MTERDSPPKLRWIDPWACRDLEIEGLLARLGWGYEPRYEEYRKLKCHLEDQALGEATW